jgi:hypothetical protein
VGENGYDLFPHEGYAISSGRKRICLTDCTHGYLLSSPRLSRAEVPLKTNTSLARREVLLLRIYHVAWWRPHPDGSMKKSLMLYWCRVQLKCDGTGWRMGGEVKGKLANGVGSQYSLHYIGTWCIQHYYRWCAHLGCR